MFYGLLNLSWVGYIVATLTLTHITIVSITVFLHRHQAHRALTMHPILSHFFRFWLWLTTGMETKAWAAIHRKHHARCETPDDPHSPQVLGLDQVMWRGAELYRREAKLSETLTRYGQGTPDDWIEHNLYSRHSAKGLYLMLAINLLLFGVPGLTIWAAQMGWAPFFAAGVINGVGHYFGYRNFECADASRNISPWGILIGGEELHNNHHAYPTSAKLSAKWWEFDIGWFYLTIFSWLGLVKVKRTIPVAKIIDGKSNIDIETLKAIISNRVHVMTTYSKKVVLPIFLQEKAKQHTSANPRPDTSLWQKMRGALMSEASLVSQAKKQTLEQFLAEHENLQRVYNFKQNLQAIWDKTSATQKELLDALHDWCVQAEKTGIPKLRDFANDLKGYSLAKI